MSTYTKICYHIIFSTKKRVPCLTKDNRKRLFKYLYEVLKNQKCHVYRINSVEDHVHILTHVHPTLAISNLVKDLKVSSSKFIKQNCLFKSFTGWQDGYACFTLSDKDKPGLVDYIKNQELHHKKLSYDEELRAILDDYNVKIDERYFP